MVGWWLEEVINLPYMYRELWNEIWERQFFFWTLANGSSSFSPVSVILKWVYCNTYPVFRHIESVVNQYFLSDVLCVFFAWFSLIFARVVLETPTQIPFEQLQGFKWEIDETPKEEGCCSTGWWFGTFFIFPYIGNNHPNWLIFFRGVQTTNQLLLHDCLNETVWEIWIFVIHFSVP